MPKIAAFPKAYMHALCKDGTMKLSEWFKLAATLDVQGLEFYAGFLEMADESNWPLFRRQVADLGMSIPMMCCSPDFTHPDKAFRDAEIAKQKRWIDMTHALGGSYCRVLSGQRRPELSDAEGVRLAADSIKACIPYAKERGVTLILENHYKDDFWLYPEFAQKMDVFCALVSPALRRLRRELRPQQRLHRRRRPDRTAQARLEARRDHACLGSLPHRGHP